MKSNNLVLLKTTDEPLPAIPLEEYHRPQLVRDSYISLNGEWDYLISKSENYIFSLWSAPITATVPPPGQSKYCTQV